MNGSADCSKCGRPDARPLFGLVERVRLCPDCRVVALREVAALQARHLVGKPEQGRVR